VKIHSRRRPIIRLPRDGGEPFFQQGRPIKTFRDSQVLGPKPAVPQDCSPGTVPEVFIIPNKKAGDMPVAGLQKILTFAWFQPMRSDAYEPGDGGKTTVRLPLMKVR
jgi:hypothetical protein